MGTISRRSLSVAAAVLAGALALWTPATLDAGGVAAYGAKITFTKGKPSQLVISYKGPAS